MDEEEKVALQKEKRKTMKGYWMIAGVVFVTFCCCILFFFIIYRYNGFANFWNTLLRVLQPIIIGFGLAYLLNPIMKFIEKPVLKFLTKKMKHPKGAKHTARTISIIGSLLFLMGIIVLLIAIIVPAVIKSVTGIVTALPVEFEEFMKWLETITSGDTQFAGIVQQGIDWVTGVFNDWENLLQNEILPQATSYLTSITSGVITGVKTFLNVIVGVVISVYVLADKEKFAGQTKKIIYAIFKPVRANAIIKTVQKSNEIFGGFISGKILDSAIIGLLAYIVLSIMKMPDTILVSVIIGATNIIPFFGPFIGAIPCLLIITLQNPIQGVYFLIFIVVLQQIDGNIIGPKILGNSTGLSPFWVVFAILVFGGLWGFAGMLLGVPTMAVIQYIVEKIVNYILRKRGLPTEADDYVFMTSVNSVTNELVNEPEKKKENKLDELEKALNTEEKNKNE